MSFEPFAPWLCLALAFAAVPLALATRRLGGATCQRRLPRGWAPRHAAATGLIGLLGLVGILVAGPLLELAAAHLLHGVGLGRDLADPATWAAAAAAITAWLGLQAWRVLLLAWPLLYALARVAEVRWAGRLALALAVVALLPLLGAVAVQALRGPEPGTALARAVVLGCLPLSLAVGLRAAPAAAARFGAWRARPDPHTTRASSIPAALAAAVSVGSGRTTGVVQVRRG